MCAIMGFSKKTYTKEELLPFFDRTRSRGPDMSRVIETPSGWLCFHRLAIMGLTEAGSPLSWTATTWSATARSTASAP